MDEGTEEGVAGMDMFLKNYKFEKTDGFVSMLGKIKIAEHILTGEKVIIQILKRAKINNMKMEEQVKLEHEVLKLLNHPRIIKLHDVIETPTDICVVMEYAFRQLFDYVMEKGRLEEDEARDIFQQVIYGKLYVGAEVDVWNCGVVLYFILCGVLPFDDHENISDLFDKIKEVLFSLPCYLSPEARDLISKMLNEPMKRITMSEIQQHPWLQLHL